MNMNRLIGLTYEQTQDILVEDILETRKQSASNSPIKISANDGSRLVHADSGLLDQIVQKMDFEDGVIKILKAPNGRVDEPAYVIELQPPFESWVREYILGQKSRPEALNYDHFYALYDLVLDINSQLQIQQSETVNIFYSEISRFPDFYLGHDRESSIYWEKYRTYRNNSFEYLKRNNCILDLIPVNDDGADNIYEYRITVDIVKFEEFHLRMAREHNRRNPQQAPETITDTKEHHAPAIETSHKVTYSKDRQVLLDGLFLLAKPDFDSENDRVMCYLATNPNRNISIDELQQETGKLQKSLHKIVENLGFQNDLRKLFFDVSKSAILFRPEITTEEIKTRTGGLIRI